MKGQKFACILHIHYTSTNLFFMQDEQYTPPDPSRCCDKFRLKIAALGQLIQDTLFNRANEVETKEEKVELLHAHADVTKALQKFV